MLALIDTCVNILETSDIFSDATEMAQCVENAVDIPIPCGYNDDWLWVYNEEYGVIIGYDEDADIHYFYREE
jgi:hypothetical protein